MVPATVLGSDPSQIPGWSAGLQAAPSARRSALNWGGWRLTPRHLRVSRFIAAVVTIPLSAAVVRLPAYQWGHPLLRPLTCGLLSVALVGCAAAGPGAPKKASAAQRAVPAAPAKRPPAQAAAQAALAAAHAGYDGPAQSGAPDPAAVPDAEPSVNPVRADGPNRPYQLGGRSYVPLTEDAPVFERGTASWYGRKFHGRRTASGERYDMHAMTAAHPTLPLPSYVRVRNPANGREVVVRVNDRGPFRPGRIIDLSHVAARKLGVHGLATVELRRLTNDEIRTGAWRTLPMDPSLAEDRRLALRRSEADLATAADAASASDAPAADSAAEAASAGHAAAASVASAAPAASASAVAMVASAVPAASTPPSAPVSEPTLAGAAALAAVAMNAPPSAGPPPSSGGNYFVHLGAFRLRDGAEAVRQRIAQDLAWLAPVLSVLGEAESYRLQAGPYPSRDHAHGVAQRLLDVLSGMPVVVERR